jgi:hypothetical protein
MWVWLVTFGVLLLVGVMWAVQIYITIRLLMRRQPLPPWQPPAEIRFDPSITTPTQNLWLLMFTFNPMGGPRCCKKMWYSFRYVNTDGRYGRLGPWTSLPVFAGAKQLPCIPSNRNCSKQCVLAGDTTGPCVSVGNHSCKNNRPVIGTVDELDYTVNTGSWYAVIHRQVDIFDPNSEGQPIGFLIGHQSDQTGGRYSWVDVAFSDDLGYGCIC